jgi:hypothetical protein
MKRKPFEHFMRDHRERPVSGYTIAEHRYRFDAPTPDPMPITWVQVRNAAPYKVGDVVLFDAGPGGVKRALIAHVGCMKTAYDDWRECYRVFRQTQLDRWSNGCRLLHPGQIQRGYQIAGLAPEMPLPGDALKGSIR